MGRSSWGLLAGLTALAAPAGGAPPGGGGRPRVAPAADVKLALSAPTTRGTWTIRVTNDGDVPVRVAADARVLSLDVTPRGARSPVRCALPEDMRPEDGDLERPLVLPPGRTYAETFEARLYCFGDAKAAALAAGSIVVAHLGWRERRSRFVEVAPIDGVEPGVAPRGSLEAPPIVLPDEATTRPFPARSAGPSGPEAPRLSIGSGGWVDAESVSSVDVPVTLRNAGTQVVPIRFRPDVLRFDVVGPGGADHCTWPAQPGASAREELTTLAPRASSTLVATLPTYCDPRVFDRGGLLVVRARLDTRSTSPGSADLPVYEGEVVATDTTLVRLHRGRTSVPPSRPKLEASP